MERLTYEKSRSRWNEGRCPTKYTSRYTFQEVVARLAAYEDTGLEPEGVEAQSIALAQCKPYVDAICDEHGKMLINPIRLAELAQAEKDGRLVVLPETSALDRKSFVDGLRDYFQEASYCDISTGIFGMSEGEKKLASALMNTLTREEAEAALKKREADNEAD